MKPAWTKALVVFGGGFVLAAILGAAANLFNLGETPVYLLGAAAIALVAGLGVPWALGWTAPLLFKHRDEVQAHKAAVIADASKQWVTFSYDQTFLIARGLQEHGRGGKCPVIYPASGAITIRLAPNQGVSKRVKVVDLHQYDPTMFSGATRKDRPPKSSRPRDLVAPSP